MIPHEGRKQVIPGDLLDEMGRQELNTQGED
jgi:hypothetical protein